MNFTRRGLNGLLAGGSVAALLGFAGRLSAATDRAASKLAVREFHFSDGSGARRTLADVPARAFLLNFWATWCPPCVAEMPSLDRLQEMLSSQEIKILPLSADTNGRIEVERFYRRHNLRNLGIWLDADRDAAVAYEVQSLPTSVLTDGTGREIARVEGAAQWDAPQLVAMVRRLAAGAVMR